MKTAPVLLAALLLTACGDDPQARLARAREAFARHDYPSAQVDLAAALAAAPENPAAVELQARTALAMGDGIAAGAALDRLPPAARPKDHALLVAEAALLRERPDDVLAALGSDSSARAMRLRALALLAEKDDEGAARAFEEGTRRYPADAPLLAAHARFSLMAGRVAEARDLAARALRVQPDLLDAMLADAQVATAQGNLAAALAAYERAQKAYPGNLAAIAGRAAVLGDLGRTREMAEVLASATGAGAEPALAYLQARAAAAAGNWKTARDILQANERTLAGRNDATVLYAQALMQLGQPEQARARLAPLLTRAPDSALVRRELARAQLAAGDARGAAETLRPLVARPEADAEDVRTMAKAARESGDPAAAALAARATFPSPQSLASGLAAADTAMKARNWASAVETYERIIAVTDGRSPLVLNNLAIAHSALGNKRKALDYATRALREAPQNPSVMDTLAWLLVETGGDRARAVELLRQAAAKAPGNATIRDHLARATQG